MSMLIMEEIMNGTHDPTLTLREARVRYFRDNHFGEDGGYSDAWVDFKLGPLPMPFPNTEGRLRAVRYHDLHHILTGYATDTLGEFEISAWEIGAGCENFWAAWVLNLSGMTAGMMVSPGRISRAFARGLGSRTLYGEELEAQLGRTVGEVRAERLGEPARGAGVAARLAGALGVGFVVMTMLTCIVVPLVPVGLVMGRFAPRKPSGAGAG